MREQAFQNRLLVELSRLPGVRVWRQNSGKVVARRGGAVKGAPVGAADITGIVAPEGWRLEIECKGEDTRVTAAQKRWLKMVAERGGIAVLVRADEGLGCHNSINNAVEDVRAAIAQRRAGG